VATQLAFEKVIAGEAESTPALEGEGLVSFDFDGFGFLMREDYTRIEE
jgi:hypothetical protein